MLAKDAYNSETFNQAFVNLGLSEDVPGYLYVVTGMGTRVLKIVDAGRAEAFTTLPASTNRDLIDVNLSNGGLMVSNGWNLIPVNGLPEFDGSFKEIELKAGEASWFRIGESAVNTDVVMASRPEDSAVYVYNKYGEAIYSSHIIGSTNILPMPKDGKIMFISGSDGKVTLN